MGFSVAQTYLSDVLHAVSQGLLVPTILLLLVLIGYSLFCIGSVIAEYFTERQNFKATMPKFLAALMNAEESDIPKVIENSGLLNRQKIALLTVFDYRMLPGDALMALIRRLVDEEETRYDRITGRNNMAARIAPMIGLMGTLIPLGPGIEALGRADTTALSSSLLIAFDTTVAGLVTAAVCLAVGKIRSNWYGNYMSALDSGMATMLEKIEEMRAAGKITVEKPSDYAFLFERAHSKEAVAKEKAEKAAKAAEAAKEKASAAEDAKQEDAAPRTARRTSFLSGGAGASSSSTSQSTTPFSTPNATEATSSYGRRSSSAASSTTKTAASTATTDSATAETQRSVTAAEPTPSSAVRTAVTAGSATSTAMRSTASTTSSTTTATTQATASRSTTASVGRHAQPSASTSSAQASSGYARAERSSQVTAEPKAETQSAGSLYSEILSRRAAHSSKDSSDSLHDMPVE